MALKIKDNVLIKVDESETQVVIPENVTTIGRDSFNYTNVETLVIPSSVKKIQKASFNYELKEVKITDLKSWLEIDFEDQYSNPLLRADKFYINDNLITDLVIPEDTQIIKKYAFSFFSNLESITIPSSVKKIDSDAFESCKNLKRVNISDLKSWLEIDFEDPFSNPLHNGADLYLNGIPVTEIIVPQEIKEIKKFTFYNCKTLESIKIGDSVTKINDCAFFGCEKLKEITIPDNLEIEKTAFKHCNIDYLDHKSLKIRNGCILTEDETEVVGCANYLAKEIKIPETVKKLGEKSFIRCENLETIEIPNSVTELEEPKCWNGIFKKCSNLKNVTLPTSITKIPSLMFSDCQKLESIKIPEGVTEIGHGAFDGCKKLSNIEFPDTLEKFCDSVFRFCDNLKNITIPSSVKYVGSRVFSPNEDTVINYLGTAKDWGKIKFYSSSDKSELKQYVKVLQLEKAKKEKIKQIKAVGKEGLLRAYSENIGLNQKIINDKDSQLFELEITDFNNKIFTFYLDSKTSNRKLSELNNAFEEIRADGKLITVEKIKETAQKNVKSFSWSISKIDDNSTEFEEFYINKFDKKEKRIYENYKKIVLNSEITIIEESAFKSCRIESIELLDSITEIKDNAFYFCENLKNVRLPKNLTSIPYCAFSNCKNLTSIEIPETVTEICSSAFSNCKSLEKIELPPKITTINCASFEGCEKITEITIPDGVTTIKTFAFNECKNLTTVNLPPSVTKIDSSSFEGTPIRNLNAPDFVIEDYFAFSKDKKVFLYCTNPSLKNIVIPDGVQEIDGCAFSSSRNLESVEIPESVTKIGNSAFHFCSKLKNIKLPSRLKSLGENAFDDCGIESIEIPNSVTTIGKSAFSGCSNLKSVKLSNKMKVIQPYVFCYCKSLELVEMPISITSINHDAFLNSPNVKIKYEGTKEDWANVKLNYNRVSVETK